MAAVTERWKQVKQLYKAPGVDSHLKSIVQCERNLRVPGSYVQGKDGMASSAVWLVRSGYMIGRDSDCRAWAKLAVEYNIELLAHDWTVPAAERDQKYAAVCYRLVDRDHFDAFRFSLMCAAILGDWKRAAELTSQCSPDMKLQPGKPAALYYTALGKLFSDAPDARAALEAVIQTRSKPFRLQAEVMLACLDNDRAKAEKSLTQFMKHWFDRDGMMDWCMAPEGTMLYFWIQHTLGQVTLPEEHDKYIVRF